MIGILRATARALLAVVFGFAVILIAWYAVWRAGRVNPTLLASPLEVYRVLLRGEGMDKLGSFSIWQHAGATISRALVGWAWSLLLGTACGLLLGLSRRAQAVLDPAIEFIRSTPPVLALPVFAVAFNYSDTSYIATIVFGCVPAMMISVSSGMRSVSAPLREILWLYKVPVSRRILASVTEVTPALLLGARITLSLAIIISTVTEMVITPMSTLSIGGLARDAESRFHTPIFYAAVVIIGAFGFISNYLLRVLSSGLGATESETSSS